MCIDLPILFPQSFSIFSANSYILCFNCDIGDLHPCQLYDFQKPSLCLIHVSAVLCFIFQRLVPLFLLALGLLFFLIIIIIYFFFSYILDMEAKIIRLRVSFLLIKTFSAPNFAFNPTSLKIYKFYCNVCTLQITFKIIYIRS